MHAAKSTCPMVPVGQACEHYFPKEMAQGWDPELLTNNICTPVRSLLNSSHNNCCKTVPAMAAFHLLQLYTGVLEV